MDSFAAFIIGCVIGFIVAWLPYGNFFLAVFGILLLIYFVRYALDAAFRNGRKSARRFSLFMGFWIIIGIFYIRPSGLEARLDKMDIDNARVADLASEWSGKLKNVEIAVSPDIAGKRVSIHTITPITVAEAVELVGQKTAATARFEQDVHGRSISRGPHIRVIIEPRSASESEDEQGEEEPLILDYY